MSGRRESSRPRPESGARLLRRLHPQRPTPINDGHAGLRVVRLLEAADQSLEASEASSFHALSDRRSSDPASITFRISRLQSVRHQRFLDYFAVSTEMGSVRRFRRPLGPSREAICDDAGVRLLPAVGRRALVACGRMPTSERRLPFDLSEVGRQSAAGALPRRTR